MSSVVDIIDAETYEVVKTIGPMSDRKAQRVENGLLINLDDEKFFTQIIKVVNTDYDDTRPMEQERIN